MQMKLNWNQTSQIVTALCLQIMQCFFLFLLWRIYLFTSVSHILKEVYDSKVQSKLVAIYDQTSMKEVIALDFYNCFLILLFFYTVKGLIQFLKLL